MRRPHINLWPVAVVGLSAALVALGTWVLVRIAPVTTEGDFATTLVSYTDEAGGYGTLLTVFQLDEGKVARQWDFELGATPPFDARAVNS